MTSNRIWYEATIHINSDDKLIAIVADFADQLANRLDGLGFPNAGVTTVDPDRITFAAYHEDVEA